ncbi:hypothetical protein EYC58_02690 [Candidatus Saccharibacteria bacterium]|nr:MAG: hypothetical protein EYC58_02690 [Candidatus Saccharibacteria bacterium]
MKKYGLLIAIFAASIILMVVIVLSIVSRPAPAPASAGHDATNSDGHHSAETEKMGDLIDLTSQSEVSIDIKDFKYSQANIKIKKGTKVTWTNRDVVEHNVMQDHSDSDTAHDAPTPENINPNVLAGPLLAKGESYSFTFNEATSAPYHCSPHPYMKGSVTVVE